MKFVQTIPTLIGMLAGVGCAASTGPVQPEPSEVLAMQPASSRWTLDGITQTIEAARAAGARVVALPGRVHIEWPGSTLSVVKDARGEPAVHQLVGIPEPDGSVHPFYVPCPNPNDFRFVVNNQTRACFGSEGEFFDKILTGRYPGIVYGGRFDNGSNSAVQALNGTFYIVEQDATLEVDSEEAVEEEDVDDEADPN